MSLPRKVCELKKAIHSSKKCFVYVVFGKSVQGGTPLGGYVEAYKSHLLDMMKNYQLSNSQYDGTVQCFFRVEPETQHLYIEGFQAA